MRGYRIVPGLHPAMATSATLVSVVLALSVGLSACEQKAAPVAPPPPEVFVTDVVQKDVPIYSEWVGTMDGNINAQIRARIRGHLQARRYTEGTLVRTGDLLFVIDPRSYQATLDQAKGELGRADAALTKTQQDVARYTPLAAQGAISQQELDNAVQAHRAAKSAVDAARANVAKAQLDLDWTRVQAPIDGIAGISIVQVGIVQVGDLVGEDTVLTTVSQVDPIKVSFPISEQDYLRYADRIQLNAPDQRPREATLELILADGSVHSQRGRASVVNRQVDIKTGTMMVVALFPNPGNLLRPGLYAKVRAGSAQLIKIAGQCDGGGQWQLLECAPAWEGNCTWDCFLACAWHGRDGKRLLVVVNYAPNQRPCYVRLPFTDLGGSQWRLQDQLEDVAYDRDGSDLQSRGLYIDALPWHASVFTLTRRS